MTDEAAVRRQDALRSAVETGLVSEAEPVVGLLDVAGVRQAATSLHAAFATPGVAVEHTFAVKAASLVPVLALLGQYGLGAEVASPGELALARAAGIPPEKTVLDSPAKTTAELREALSLGIAVNVDNPQEIARIDALLAAAPSASPIGLRVNPQVGGGSIDAMSTATATSKFGVALRDPGAEEWVLRTYAERPWLNRLHTHTGSQGVPLPLMAAGVRAAYDLAERINAAAGRRQVTVLDIGGGLPVNFGSDDITPSFGDYADLLRAEVPGLFDGRYGIVTEFGRALLAKHGTVLARVEYAKSAGGRPIAVTHAGAQVATRTVFAPDAWPLRVLALDAAGRPKTGAPVVQDVAGPCCFAGDLVARGRELPPLDAGDHVALLDTGAYYFSTHFAYNSLPRPAVWAFTAVPGAAPAFAPVRAAQSMADLLAESGAGLPPLTP
ncbi:type III PLP-dependent enzyme domain-containing protein [Actinacidiphila bryophytorum]|uniref:diaminopimelate decarboxylase n=1 Tax=Actinacidiphila bryophytorum TaxID=1436133 RepID=UPI002176CAAA|nr:diaminopimelate decarboxylase [Actinacidiphila bryophytorum]UWE08135.1 diaminopimelate decarboxylase [Actinacidiphila bryophytorum]